MDWCTCSERKYFTGKILFKLSFILTQWYTLSEQVPKIVL
ncbi:hypothetical protein Pan161_61390 [Gimesia algae]|uniref:Uncharacterized protein n=1 Tax=Gimesia algae TaxID=2527971 RepID=A0A517VN73_9PLAN|nr:hypothetical protein Pan161_61390 [Gimesia algae]